MDEKTFSQKIASSGGKAFIVGGWVRDRLRGVPPRDKDYVITGLSEKTFLVAFPEAFRTGSSFPVYRMEIDGYFCDVALARSETKSGSGHRGFSVKFSPSTSISDDLFRRDITINSIALSLKTGEYIDPYGGIGDIESRVIRATSERFVDDPVRALRAARQSAETGFSIDKRTFELMASCREELQREPAERMVAELEKALSSEKPSLFFRNLRSAGILDIAYPHIHALIGRSQPEAFHPEGDAFEHTMQAVDKSVPLTPRLEVRFAALAHDLGKALTPDEKLPRHHGHDQLGIEALNRWNRTMRLPGTWLKCARFAITEHMRVHQIKKPGKIADFITKLRHSTLGLDGFKTIILCDSKEIPDILERYGDYERAFQSISGRDAPSCLSGSGIGAWLRRERAKEIRKVAADAVKKPDGILPSGEHNSNHR